MSNFPVRRLLAVVIIVTAGSVLPGCGGQSKLRTSDSEADGGTSSGGGSSFGGTSGTGGNTDCYFEGRYYAYGESFPRGDGCNTCGCVREGAVTCTLLDCQRSCVVNGILYADGASFSVEGGCGTCACDGGDIICVSVPCPESRCDMLFAWYNERVMFGARRCDPSTVSCTILVNSTLPCGCKTFVSDDSDLEAWRDEWEFLDCGSPTPCIPCPSPPNSAFCSPEGTCIDAY
jgi:hypothetical protein